ncbi:ATP-binding cassette domain-containing protein [Candidatus Falkowbacteria bacterium]|nr:ATP-binding cassette domain-containing protein [Candidatus Falkowbacteria bacterium]
MPIIEVKNLTKVYDYYKKQPGLIASIKSLFKREKLFTEAVKAINFNIDEGELVGFLGPNGAGKTTTLKMLSGILHPSSGEATVLGFTPHKRQKEYQKQFALVMGQKNQLWWDLPAMESFILNKEIYEVSESDFKHNLDELVELLDIKDILDIQVRKLSLGQRMKCELVAALLHRPKILFLDEPTIGLDVVAQKNIRDFIKKYNKEKKTTIILTSHYMDDIRELCKRVVIIDHGKIIYDGLLDDLIKRYAPQKILKVTFNGQGITKKEAEIFGKVAKYNQYEIELEVGRDEVKDVAKNILSSEFPVDDIMIDEVDIDEVIRKIFKEEHQ